MQGGSQVSNSWGAFLYECKWIGDAVIVKCTIAGGGGGGGGGLFIGGGGGGRSDCVVVVALFSYVTMVKREKDKTVFLYLWKRFSLEVTQ